MTERTHDVAVIGAGPTGATLALLAARAGATVVLIERSRLDVPRMGETAPPELRPALASMGLEDLLQDRTIALDSSAIASVWGDQEPAERHYIFSAFGPALHLDRITFDRAIARRAEQAGATLRVATRVRTISSCADGHALVLDSGDTVRARYLVLASGRRSTSHSGIHARRVYLDDHVCLLALLSGQARESRTLVEAVNEGWFYASRLPGERMVVTLTTRAGLVPKRPWARTAFWHRALAATKLIAAALDNLRMPERISVCDARSSAARLVGGANWCVLGDARFASDPLSGQGTLLALSDAQFAVRYLLEGRTDCLAADLRQRSHFDLRSHALKAAGIYGGEKRFAESEFWSVHQRSPLAANQHQRRDRVPI
jgi:flavin-dependent dehydrogenase